MKSKEATLFTAAERCEWAAETQVVLLLQFIDTIGGYDDTFRRFILDQVKDELYIRMRSMEEG